MMKMADVILTLTTTASALMAGLFFSYSFSVVLGFGKLSDAEYIKAMQSVNREIKNPVFFACFFGVLLLLPVSTWFSFSQSVPVRFWLLLAATVIYFIGVFCVTILGNVPLNNALESFNLFNATNETINFRRSQFEVPWNNLNMVRTISSLLTFVLIIIACFYDDKIRG